MKMPPHPSPVSRHAFSLLEVLVAAAMMAVVVVAALTGVIALQRSYAATEEYATGLADQMRLLDFLAQDLRRAVATPETDTDGQGIKVTVPNYYRFNASDPQHLFPIANNARVNSEGTAADYFDPANPSVTTQVIAYRFVGGAITRTDPWQPLVESSTAKGQYVSSGPVTVATNMDAFPTIATDAKDTTGAIVHYNITFHSIFQPLAGATQSNAITLHNVTFVRSKNLTR